jgi:ATP-dependent helicase/nuclease subunit B
MPATVRVVAGPRAARRERLLAAFRPLADAPETALWLLPTRRALADLRARLAAEFPVLVGLRLHTPESWADAVVRDAAPATRPAPAATRRALVEAAAAALARRGRLGDLAAAAESRGFVSAAADLFARLAEAGVGLAGLARAVGGPDAPLARLFILYRRTLDRHHRVEPAGLLTRALALLPPDGPGPLAGVRHVFLEVASDWTRPRLDLAAALAGRVGDLWVSLPDAPGDPRDEVFATPRAVAVRLGDVQHVDADTRDDPSRPAGLAHLERHLFDEGAAPGADAAGLGVLEAPGALGEARMVARRVRDLLDGGVPAAAVLVAARSLGPWADLLAEVFDEYGIPHEIEGDVPLSRNPAVAALLRAARLAEDDWPFAGVTALLRSDYLRPNWPSARGPAGAAHARDTEALLRMLGETRGRESYRNAVRAWAESPPRGLEDEQAEEPRRRRKHELARRCRDFLDDFLRAGDIPPASAALAGHVAALRSLADTLGLSAAARESVADADALERFWAELAALPSRPAPLSRARFLALAAAVAAAAGRPRSRPGPGRVRVLPAEEARHLTFDHVFVVGLGERGFPDLSPPTPLLTPAQLDALAAEGTPLAGTGDRRGEEMRLFLDLVAAARRSLTLSYAAVDDRGQDLLPSPFLRAVREAFVPGALEPERQRMLIEGYDHREPLSPAEARVAAALRLRAGDDAGLASLPADTAAHLRAARDLHLARVTRREFTPFDGLLRDPAVLAELARRFGPEKVFSPTALERYIACPFRFFLEQVLRLEPLEEPGGHVEHTRRGAAVHRALSRLHRRLRAPAPEVGDELVKELGVAVQEYAERAASAAARELWRLEGLRLRRAAARYPGHWEKFTAEGRSAGGEPAPWLCEADFGLPPAADAMPDAMAEALVIRAGDVEVRLGGRIDRIDLAEGPDGPVFWVIDYKTGRGSYYTSGDLETFRKLQLPLYALAVERVFLAGRAGRPAALAYWMVAEDGPKRVLPSKRGRLASAAVWPAYRERLEAWVAEVVGRVRAGDFPLAPRDRDCTQTCAFAAVCRITPARAAPKTFDLALPVLPSAGDGSGNDE